VLLSCSAGGRPVLSQTSLLFRSPYSITRRSLLRFLSSRGPFWRLVLFVVLPWVTHLFHHFTLSSSSHPRWYRYARWTLCTLSTDLLAVSCLIPR